MNTSQTSIRRTVREWMTAEAITQKGLAKILQITQPKVSKRLNGITPWTFDDLDRLTEAGCPIELRFYGGLDVEVPA